MTTKQCDMKPTASLRRVIRVLLPAMLIGPCVQAAPQEYVYEPGPKLWIDVNRTIDFDDVASGTVIDNYYSGVTFNNPRTKSSIYAVDSPLVSSMPSNVVSVDANAAPFDSRYGAVEAVFFWPASYVSIDAAIARLSEGAANPSNYPKMEVYDTQGHLKQVVSWDFAIIPQPAFGFAGFQKLSYQSTASDIGKVRIMSGNPGTLPSNFGIFDNLSFTVRELNFDKIVLRFPKL